MMDCKQTLETLCDLSAQACDENTARAVQQHLAKCPPCEKEWRELQLSLLHISTTTQFLPSSDQSRVMWAACEKRFAAAALSSDAAISSDAAVSTAPPLPSAAPSPSASRENAPSISIGERLQQMLGLQPRFGWFALGGAFALLCGALLTSPSATLAPTPAENNVGEYSRVVQSSVRDEAPTRLVSTQQPPRNAALFIDHHTAMGFDPFTDHVGPTLVSFSASSPSAASSER